MRFLLYLFGLTSLAFCPGGRIFSPDTDQSVMATLWYQKSGEMRALYYQAFNLAELRIREYLLQPEKGKTPAVVFDIDETLLDNSPSEALNIVEGKPYSPDRWRQWSDQGKADALPGSVDFCRFLAEKGIEVFYISNRMTSEIDATIRNMENLRFPVTERSRYLLKSDVSSKEARRNLLRNNYDLILLVGDNLADFDRIFEDRTVGMGFHTVDSLRGVFGNKFILLPNPMYGDWTKPLTVSQKEFSPRKRAHYRRSLLRID